jgi:hypothetical protein
MGNAIYNWVIALASVATAGATVGLVVFALVHWKAAGAATREASKTRSAQVLLEIYRILTRLRPKWHQLYGLPDEVASWTEKQRKLADEVGTELQRVAFLCMKDLVDSEFVMESWGKVFVKCWYKLEPTLESIGINQANPEFWRPVDINVNISRCLLCNVTGI